MTPKMQVEALLSYATKVLGLTRFAVLYPDEKYGKTFMNLYWDRIIAYGGILVGLESYHPGHTDFADPIKRLVGLYYEAPEDIKEAAQPPEQDDPKAAVEPRAIVDFDAVFIPDAPSKAGLIIPQLAYYDVVDVVLLGTNLWHSDRLIEMAGQFLQSAIMPDGFFSESPTPRIREFVQGFRAVYGESPGFIEAVAYDTAMILFGIAGRPDVRLRSRVRQELQHLHRFPGLTGTTSFDQSGESRKKPYLLRVIGDRFIQIDAPSALSDRFHPHLTPKDNDERRGRP